MSWVTRLTALMPSTVGGPSGRRALLTSSGWLIISSNGRKPCASGAARVAGRCAGGELDGGRHRRQPGGGLRLHAPGGAGGPGGRGGRPRGGGCPGGRA